MAQDQLFFIGGAVLFEVLARSDAERLVQPDVDDARGKPFGDRLDHVFDERIDAVVAHHQNVIGIEQIEIFGILAQKVQMRKSVDLRDELDAARFGVCVHFAQVLRRIAAALVVEVRFFLDLIRVRHAEVQPVVPHARQNVEVPFDRFHLRHDAAGTFHQGR